MKCVTCNASKGQSRNYTKLPVRHYMWDQNVRSKSQMAKSPSRSKPISSIHKNVFFLWNMKQIDYRMKKEWQLKKSTKQKKRLPMKAENIYYM